MISVSNYEEWFILYMDNELNAEQKKMVEDFLLLHPQLQEEMELLQSTKLSAEDIVFSGKEELTAESMKLNTVDEALLLYIDNELSAAERKKIEEKIASDKDYRLQYDLLQATKLDATEIVFYPDKKELYRHSEKRVLFPVWMQMAAAVVILLFGGYFFLLNTSDKPATPGDVVTIEKEAASKKPALPVNNNQQPLLPQQKAIIAKATTEKKAERKKERALPVFTVEEMKPQQPGTVKLQTETVAVQKVDAVHIDLTKVNTPSITALNKTVTNLPVTSVASVTYNLSEDPEESAVTDGDNHRTPAKGFLRKVSRFIERRTGIGTVNADNELLVGAVALKLN